MKVNLTEIEVGDIFSEESHYIVKEVKKEGVVFEHLESGKIVNLSNEYVHNMLNTSDQYEKEVKEYQNHLSIEQYFFLSHQNMALIQQQLTPLHPPVSFFLP